MKKFYFLLTCFCLSFILCNSQTIATGEYFVDKDPGLGKGISVFINPADTVKSVTVPVSVAGLPLGYHYLYIRVKDSYGHWGNYRRQRFYVYKNDTIKPNNDSVYLVQAEYFIDTVPTPGKGKLIDLPHVGRISYDDSIRGFVADNLIHSVGVRVKDNKGAWSFIKSDTVATGGLNISVTAPPYIKQNEKTKYTVTIKNTSSKDFYDLFLIVRSANPANPNFGESIDTINGVNVSIVSGVTEFDSSKYIPIWIYSIPKLTEKTFDFYMETTEGKPHEILPQQFEIYYDFKNTYNVLFRMNGDTSDFKNSRLFSMLYSTVYFEQNNVPAFNIADSLIVQKLDSSFKLTANLFKEPILINKLIKPVINKGFNLNISDSSTILYSTYSFAFLRQSYFEEDGIKKISIEGINNKTTNQKCSTQCSLNCYSPFEAPLLPVKDFEITSFPCKKRCACECIGGTQQNIPDVHQGLDISIKTDASPETKENWDRGYEVKSISGGTVVYADWENPKGPNKGAFEVAIEAFCKEGSEGAKIFIHYLHLKPENIVHKDSIVMSGQVIGHVANYTSGFSTGPHLHLEIFYKEDCNVNDLISHFGYDPDSIAAKDDTCPSPKFDPCIKDIPPSCVLPDSTLLNFGGCAPSTIAWSCTGPEFITPNDPNDKTGNIGYGIPQYITKNEQLHYGILFENKGSASAPAQVVTIKDTLDKSKIDANSLKIESVTAGEMLVVLPDSVHIQNLDTVYTKQPVNGTYVHVQTTFDTSSGVLEFKMTSLDTLTLQPVTDPLAGFLPPDTSNFDGNGLVSFKVMPKSTIADGSVIYNTAHIIFDKNPSIATGTWFNTIDKSAPSSYVNALPEKTYDTSFKVSWQGVDSGAGIIYYDIYFKKKNDTAYIKWLSETSDTSAIFIGQLDSTYEFYSIAYDSLLNVESAPDTADAITTISSSVLAVNLKQFSASCTLQSVSLKWTTADESGVKYYTIEKSMNGTNWVSTQHNIIASNNSVQNVYTFSDTYNGYNFYKLRITDNDGKTSYSSIDKVNCNKIVNSMQAYPVPAKNLLNVLIQYDKEIHTNILLTDAYGRIIKNLKVNIVAGTNLFSLNTNDIANGQYILKIENPANLNSQKIIIIH